MTTSLIISTYNRPDALELCLKSILKQSVMPTEVIVADDGSRADTKTLIERYHAKFSVPLIHVWHQDSGFRLALIRNKAIAKASGNYIIQIDGDVILHPKFVADHLFFAKANTFVKGRRCMIGPKTTKQLLINKSIAVSYLSSNISFREHGFRLKWYYLFFKAKEKPTADGVLGSNMAFYKSDFLAVNGYNNNFLGWGAEDKELAQRFVNFGLFQRKMKFLGIQFHLHHLTANKKNHDSQMQYISQLIETKQYYCQNGIQDELSN